MITEGRVHPANGVGVAPVQAFLRMRRRATGEARRGGVGGARIGDELNGGLDDPPRATLDFGHGHRSEHQAEGPYEAPVDDHHRPLDRGGEV
jgi:hypothetical protein